MAFTLEQISTWLTEKETKHKHDKEKELIIFGTGNGETHQSHFIRAREDGELFDWGMQLLDADLNNMKIADNEYSAKILSHMLYMNFSTKFGTWEFDPSDGDIRLQVEIPLEDALMTQKQFSRIYGFMTKNGQEGADAIRHIMKTGEVPDDTKEEDMIAKLEEMLAQLKAEETSSEEGI